MTEIDGSRHSANSSASSSADVSASALDQIAVLHLRYFVAVAEAGTVRAAAELIGISQPSLSQQIAQLERRLGVRLFDRSATGMRLTDAGRRLLAIATETVRALHDLARLASGVLRIGVPRGIDASVLQTLTNRFGAEVDFVALDSSRAGRALGREIDLAVVRGPMKPQRGVTATVLRRTPLGVLMSSEHHLAQQTEASWTVLSGQSLLWFDERRAPEYAAWLLDRCHEHGWRPALHRLDPAGSALVADALRRDVNLVALRPEHERGIGGDGLAWVPLAKSRDEPLNVEALYDEPPYEELLLVRRAKRSLK